MLATKICIDAIAPAALSVAGTTVSPLVAVRDAFNLANHSTPNICGGNSMNGALSEIESDS
jgi:hypothetical protein